MSEHHLQPPDRRTAASMTLAVFAGAYVLLGCWYFYVDFFRFLAPGAATLVDGSGYAVQVDCARWSVLSPWRVLLFVATLGLLGTAAMHLWRRKEGARALALFALWGAALPQLFWFTELAVDWFGGRGLPLIVVAAVALVMIPTALLYEGAATLHGWKRVQGNRARVLGTAVAAAWIAFAASEFIDHSYQLDSSLAYGGATSAIVLGILAVAGLLRARVWGLLAAVAAASGLMVVPLAFMWTSYWPTGGYIDGFVSLTSGSPAQSIVASVVPLLVVGAAAAPLLRNFTRRLRNGD